MTVLQRTFRSGRPGLSSLVVSLGILSPGVVQATGQDSSSDLLEGHSGHGEVFNDGPRQSAYLMHRPDSVHLPVTCSAPQAQAFFDQGLGQLHGFWYFEAERSFRQVAMIDPDCAMAYWGMAMANRDNPERARGFARVGWLKRGLVTKHEGMYIDSIARFHGVEGPEEPKPDVRDERKESEQKEEAEDPKRAAKRKSDLKKRAEKLVREYEKIIWEYPDDIEAKALLANRLWLNRRLGIPTVSRASIEALLQQVFAKEPEHPAHHYRIHLWDEDENAERVVDSAVRSGPSWPSVAHMWHMGGHIFARLGRHTDAAWQQEASARVDHAHMIRDRVLPDQIHNFAHNNEWLSRSLRHHGRVSESVELSKNMIELPRHPRYNRLDDSDGSASYGRRRLLETLGLFERWDQLVALSKTMYLEASSDATDRAELAYRLGVAHAFREDEEGYYASVADLESLLDELKSERVDALERVEDESLEEGGTTGDASEEMEAVLADFATELDDVRDKKTSLDALWSLLLGAESEESLKRLEKHGFEKAHLSRLYLAHGLQDKAEELARKAANNKKGQIYFHANLATVLHAVEKTEEALEVFDELREWSALAELDVPVFQRLRPLADLRELPADWRLAVSTAPDLGMRPDITSLGPLRWTPPPALDWALPDGFGEQVSLSDYRGRPVLVIFFLGFGCVHCVEQLGVFAPVAEKYREAGIEIVAIGTDTVEQLARSQADDTEEIAYPFPILSDSRLDVFRSYRAHDDFEGMALHGTFLIDARGRVRWQDISFEPFMECDFLLEESLRLLGLPDSETEPQPASTRATRADAPRNPGSQR